MSLPAAAKPSRVAYAFARRGGVSTLPAAAAFHEPARGLWRRLGAEADQPHRIRYKPLVRA